MKVKVFHVSGIPAGTHEVVRELKTKVIVLVNGVEKSFSKKTKRQLGSPSLTLTYREVK